MTEYNFDKGQEWMHNNIQMIDSIQDHDTDKAHKITDAITDAISMKQQHLLKHDLFLYRNERNRLRRAIYELSNHQIPHTKNDVPLDKYVYDLEEQIRMYDVTDTVRITSNQDEIDRCIPHLKLYNERHFELSQQVQSIASYMNTIPMPSVFLPPTNP